jgi:carbon monoxide dehydrogenase subunit G
MRVSEKRRIQASRETVWAWVCDPARYPDFMDGVSRWTVQGDNKASGCGARWDVRLQIGAAPIGVEQRHRRDDAWPLAAA